jgi:sugar phosphate permease
MVAQAGISAVQLGLPAIAPELRAGLGLSLAGVGALLAAPSLGIILTLLAWGALADRIGERAVIGAGLSGAAVALCGAALVEGAWAMGACLVAAGALGSAANAASGRAVVAWFPSSQRGFALGWRHMSTPLGGAIAAATLPFAAHAGGVSAALVALACACALGAITALLLIRSPRAPATAPPPRAARERGPLRDGGIWRLSLGTGAVVLCQLALLSFVALYLHDERGWSVGAAAGALAAIQLTGAASRVVAGAWSDRIRSRLVPLRSLALTAAITLAAATILLPVPGPAGPLLLIAAAVVAMAGNGISFAAASEMVGARRVGTALGLQNTVLFCAVVIAPPTFGLLVGAIGWEWAFAAAACCPVIGWATLGPLRGRLR